jgi:peptide/nickel transport system substrate-binding protein
MAALMAAGCGGGSGSTKTSGGGGGANIKEGGLLRVGTTDKYDSLNPFLAYSAQSYVTFTNIYPTLVQYDHDYKIEGDWAESWETSSDGLTWTFKLKPGGKWSDGKPLTAADCAWTGNMIIKYASGPTAVLAPFLTHATSFEAPDDNTIVLKYDKRVSNVLPQLQQFFTLPQHVWEPHFVDNAKDLKAVLPEKTLPVVGAGAWFVERYEKNGTTILRRNDGFYGEKPHLETIGLSAFENSDAMLAAFKAGEIDEMDNVPYVAAAKLKKDPRFQIQSGVGSEVRDFAINSNPKKKDKRELLDPKVREAMSHAIDRQQMIDVVFAGYAKPAWSLLTPLCGNYLNTDLKPEEYDLDKANQILDDLGYMKGADGIRVANGSPMAYEVITPSDLYGINREFDIVRTSFQQIGIKLTQNSLDGTTAFAEITAPDNKYENFDMHMWDWVGYIDPDFVLSVVTTGQWGGWSDTGYTNPEYDKLYKDQGVAPSEEDRKNIVWQMQEILYRDKPYIQLVQVDLVKGFGKKWGGLTEPFLNGMSKRPWIEIHQTA